MGISSFLASLIPVIVARIPNTERDPDAASYIPPITERKIENYAIIGGSDAEIADRFDVDPANLRADFETVLRTSRAVGRLSLRRAQYDLAMKGNGPMLTWLGRNLLGQSLDPQTPGEAEPEFEGKNG